MSAGTVSATKRPTLEALLSFWRANRQPLMLVPKELYNQMDELIRADERAKVVRELELSRDTVRPAAAGVIEGCIQLVRGDR